jgi:hypothetical protein
MPKLIKSRKQCTCEECKATINKGDLYARKNIRLGSSRADTLENRDGLAVIVSHGITITAKLCASCVNPSAS